MFARYQGGHKRKEPSLKCNERQEKKKKKLCRKALEIIGSTQSLRKLKLVKWGYVFLLEEKL